MFKSTASQQQIDDFAQTVSQDGGEVVHKYGTVMKGFAAKLNANTLAKFNSLQEEPDSIIDYIGEPSQVSWGRIEHISAEPDGVVTTQ